MRVEVLPPLVAQQVAAGEVVDRPASVVKELVENALDAGASRVEVELEGTGAARTLVRDDGSGMGPEDAALSVLRHATSKIRSAEDLERVGTLGFRGEALPSVASVSTFTLTTSTGEGAGTRVFVDGGREAEVSPASHPKGTSVLVERLFYNVPARRAFLKGARSERAAIGEVLTNLAVAHPRVGFRLTEGGREHLSFPKASGPLERLAQVHGLGKARAMREVSHRSGPFSVRGHAALPSVTEGTRSAQTISVNGRWARSEGLLRGLDDAYRATVAAGRYPPVALAVEVDPAHVDVNVHPTKRLVRFSDENGARRAIAEAVRAAIGGTGPEGATPPPHEAAPSAAPDRPSPQPPPTGHSSRNDGRGAASSGRLPGLDHEPATGGRSSLQQAHEIPAHRERIRDASAPLLGDPVLGPDAAMAATAHVERGDLPRLEHLRVVGQVAAGYVVVEEPGAVWFVDQHVAHERAILDRLSDPGEGEAPSIQALLVPEVVRLAPSEAADASGALEELAVYGFEAEPFGKDSFRITGVISTLAERAADVRGAFEEAVAAVRGTGPGPGREGRILATIACHSAVKLGDRLAMPEMEALVKEWLTSRLPATCPHGRSICFRMDVAKDVARKLDRH